LPQSPWDFQGAYAPSKIGFQSFFSGLSQQGYYWRHRICRSCTQGPGIAISSIYLELSLTFEVSHSVSIVDYCTLNSTLN